MKNFIIKAIEHLGVLIFPFFVYSTMDEMNQNKSAISAYALSIVFYLMMLITVLFYLKYHSEKITEFIFGKLNKIKFSIYILFVITYIPAICAVYYICIYKYDPCSFQNVNGANFLERYINFFYYSLGIFLMNGNSSIEASSPYAIIFSSTEMISSFIAIVLILTNYQSLKKSH